MILIYGSFLTLQCILTAASAFPGPVIDQSQTGDLNVHINLKDLHILALLKGRTEEYVDYDYAYDYSEMTIKPNNSTTSKPASVSTVTEENATETTTQLVTERTSPARNVTTVSPTAVTRTETTVPSTPANSTATALSNGTSLHLLATVLSPLADNAASAPAPKNTTECRKNYVMNKNGECEFTLYDRDNDTNALLKLVKLSQKLKLRRENRRTNSTQDLDKHNLKA